MNFQNQVLYLPTMLNDYVLNERVDRDILNSEIMFTCGLMEPVYSEPETMKAAIEQWFASRQWTIQHLLAIIDAQYSPIENTDYRLENERNIANSGSSRNVRNLESSADNENERIDTVASFDSESWKNSAKVNGTAGATATEDETSTRTDSGTVKDGFTERKHGNIGVTTNQQLITAELAMLHNFTLYKWLAMELCSDLFLGLF